MLSIWNGLESCHDQILPWSKLKAFADDKTNVTKILNLFWGWHPFPTMFSKGFIGS